MDATEATELAVHDEAQPAPSQTPQIAPQVAAFDFDGTLTNAGSVWRFLRKVVGARRLALGALPLLWKFAVAAVEGGHWADDVKEDLFRATLGGLELAQLEPSAARFGLDHYRRHARADVRDRVEWHRSRGHRLVLVSASPELYVGPVANVLVMDVLATHLEVGEDGRLTGSYEGRNCRGVEKMDRLEHWMQSSDVSSGGESGASSPSAQEPASRPFLWAYGNSSGDAAMLEAADVGIDVGRLGRFGKLRRFPRLKDLST